MKTIKLPVSFDEKIEEDIRVYSSVVRYSFNRFQEGLKVKEIYHLCSEKFNIGSHLINSAAREAQSLYKREGNKKIIFGDFKRRVKGLITKEDFKITKLRGLVSEGQSTNTGNRLFKFDIDKVSKICIEELNISSSDKGQGKTFNRLCNNKWNREVTISNLKVLTSTYGIDLVKVNPIYSSFVGNIEYGDSTTPDMVASSIEIARRGYKKFSKGWFYPKLDTEKVKNKFNQWKEEIYSNVENWKELFLKVKKSGMRYRFQLSECDAVFERFYHKMNVITYFYI